MTRLYLVDDHAMVRDGLRAVLCAAGHDVVGDADEPTRALAEIVALAPDLVLLDVTLGDRSGFEVLEALQQRGRPVRCLLLTMSAQPRHVAEALRLGAAGYMLKEAPSAELLKAIDTAAAGRRYFSPEVADIALRALAAPPETDRVASLSARERQVALMVAKGYSSSQIGQQLHLSPKTVDTYRFRLMQKLGVGDVPALVRLAIREGLIDVND